MKTLPFIAVAFFTLSIFGCKGEKKEETKTETVETTQKEEPKTKTLEIALEPKSDSEVTGKIIFTESEGLVTMEAKLSGLTEGDHAIHIHQKADCSSSDGKSTGGHWNPTMEPHGAWGSNDGYHKGDIGNFKANAEGNGEITFATNDWCLDCDDDNKNIVGKAIIVHQGADDLKSQPSGAAGSRVSCGAIIQ